MPSPDISGLSWFGVEQMHKLPLLAQSYAHPLPNLVMAAWANSSFMDSNDPKRASIAFDISPCGKPPPLGDIVFQNIEWFQYPPPLFLTAALSKCSVINSSIDFPAISVPSIAALRFAVYPAWCFEWCISIVNASKCGSNSSYP